MRAGVGARLAERFAASARSEASLTGDTRHDISPASGRIAAVPGETERVELP